MGHSPIVIDGEECPSVTELVGILSKPFLLRWYGINGWAACEKKKKESQEKGIKFHEDVEKALKFHFGMLKDEPEWDEDVEAVVRWADLIGINPLHFEKKVISKKHKFGGTFDFSGETTDEIILVDWKRTAHIDRSYVLQLGGYFGAYLEQDKVFCNQARLIRPFALSKESLVDQIKETKNGWRYRFKGLSVGIEERRFTDLEKVYQEFLKLRDIWDFINQKGIWTNGAVLL